MCGIAGIAGEGWLTEELHAMVDAQGHRGPDATVVDAEPGGMVGLGHNRLSIIDLSQAGLQPMRSASGRYRISFNGEVYNYLELRRELDGYPFRSRTDSEVVLAAFDRWGVACLDRFIGMFAFAIWDEVERRVFLVRDRFGVKPLYYDLATSGTLRFASEIGTLQAVGRGRRPNPVAWASYLAYGLYDHDEETFWAGIRAVPAGHLLVWQDGRASVTRWYDLAAIVGPDWDARSVEVVEEEYMALLLDAVRLRFRADVPVGINLSGGLDSSTLLGLVRATQGEASQVKAFTFVTGDPSYDELPWVQQMLARTHHTSVVCSLSAHQVPELARLVQGNQDGPFGGLPTLAYAHLFEMARAEGVIVLLDGQGLDEQWAGYDYYRSAGTGAEAAILQGTREPAFRPDCLTADFAALAAPLSVPRPFSDPLQNLQYRDACHTKMPRALRFNDRISMRVSTELREPFLDHRLFELALRQRPERKVRDGTGKWLLRKMVDRLLPDGVVEAPKRALQTPQREWLRGPLSAWADAQIRVALQAFDGGCLEPAPTLRAWRRFRAGQGDNSFFVWQWISLAMILGGEAADSDLAVAARRATVA